MTTPARYRALQWILDHDVLGPDAMLSRKPPSTKMRRLMARENQVIRLPLGQFNYDKWLLTPQGRDVLQTKAAKRKRSLPRIRTETKEETDI